MSSFCACYEDDIVIFSHVLEEHLRQINLIFKRLSAAGFTINALKCKICQPQMNFLVHVVEPGTISADPQRMAPILSYLAPRNEKELRQFLGIWGFQYKFLNKLRVCSLCSSIEPYAEKRGEMEMDSSLTAGV
jgi:hypothetical protein